MTDREPKNCPRCGSDEISHGYSAPPFQWNIQCHADGCDAYAVADTEDETFAIWDGGKWTARITEYDDDGQPCDFEYYSEAT